MSDWKPGDVAMVTFAGHEVRATFYDTGSERGWWQGEGTVSRQFLATEGDVSARPLVVIDPDDETTLRRIGDLLVAEDRGYDDESWQDLQAALREFANPKPPKPEEPSGLGAVVECEHRVYDWARAVLIGNGFTPWYYTDSSGNGGLCKWDDLDVVRVVSDGTQP